MLDKVRQHVPATRTMSDGRLAALLAAIGVVIYMIADKDTFWVAAIAIGVWYALRHRKKAQVGRYAHLARHAARHATDMSRTLFDRVAPDEPAAAPAPPPIRTAASSDPLVARAEALLRRVETKG